MIAQARPALPVTVGVSLVLGALLSNAATFAPVGTEYPPAGLLLGDQVYPAVSLTSQGGWVVWQDNAGDADGSAISARKLSSGFAGTGNVIHVNQTTKGNQENASVSALSDGGAFVVWQGGEQGGQDIYARLLRPDGLFAGNEILLNTYTYAQQKNPEVALLTTGQIVVIWSSYGQDGSMEGIYAQRLTLAGAKVGSEFRVNQTTPFNQRSPSIAALDNGGFVVAWISEQNRFENSVDVYARTFNFAGNPVGGEILVNSSSNLCATPIVRGTSSGGFVTSWTERNLATLQNHWQIMARTYSGSFTSPAKQISIDSTGDRTSPRIAGSRDGLMVVWTSQGQDGSREGVFGRFLTSTGEAVGTEFQVNTYAESIQFHPALASDGAKQFMVVWSSFVGGSTTFDLLGQLYGAKTLTPNVTFRRASQSQLRIEWSTEAGTSYQIQSSTDISSTPFTDVGPARLATGTSDFILMDQSAGAGFYRIKVIP